MLPTPATRRWSMIAFLIAARVPLSRSAYTNGVNVSSNGAGATTPAASAPFVEQPQRAQAPHVAVDEQAAVVDGAGEHRVLGLVAGEGAVVHHQRARHPGLHDQAVAARQ